MTASARPVYIPWGCDPDGCPQYAADIGNPEVRAYLLAEIERLVDLGYSGVLVDDVNLTWRFSDVGGNDLRPVDPRTGEPMTLAAWRRYAADFTTEIRSQFRDLRIMHNAIWFADSPTLDDADIDRQIGGADVIMLERGATDPGLVAGPGPFGFATFLRAIDRMHRLGTDVLLLDEAPTTTDDLWFNLATTLLVNEGGDLVATEAAEFIDPLRPWPGFATDLGDVLGPRREVAPGAWRRDFTGGLVLVNEPGRGPVTIDLTEPMRTIDGTVTTSVTLRGGAAAVLTPR